jgi:cold shock CspA family protein
VLIEGEIKHLNRDKGYGFIRGNSRDSDLKSDYFFPANENPELFNSVNIGDSVTFQIAVDHLNRFKAIDIKSKGENE